MKKIIVLSIIVCNITNTVAQSPYQLAWKTDGIIAAGILGLTASDILLNRSLDPLTEDQVLALDPSQINRFDRWASRQNSSAAGFRSDIGQNAPIIASLGTLLLYPSISNNEVPWVSEFAILATLFLEINLVNSGITDIVKASVKRPRPYTYDPERSLESKLSKNTRKSFFSGHTSASAANSYFLARVFSDYYPESKWKPAVWGLAVMIPAWTGLERVLAGKHFPTDVIAGYIVGASCGILIPHIHKMKTDGIELSFTGNGLILAYTF